MFCVCICCGVLDGKQINPEGPHEPWHDLDRDSDPKECEDLATFVHQKIAGMERQLASQGMIIHQKDVVIESLVRRVSDLETIVKMTTEEQESSHRTSADLDFPTTDVDDTDHILSTVNDTAILHEHDGFKITSDKVQNTQSQLSDGKATLDTKRHSDQYTLTSFSTIPNSTPQNEDNCNCDSNRSMLMTANISKSRQTRVAEIPRSMAFHASLSNRSSFKTNAAVVFDNEALDNGNGYTPTDGIYIVPESGIYVFTWTMLAGSHQEFDTHLVVNGQVKGSSFSDTSENGDYYQSTAVVVISVSAGDHIFIRMGYTTQAVGDIVSTDSRYGQSTFSGWQLD